MFEGTCEYTQDLRYRNVRHCGSNCISINVKTEDHNWPKNLKLKMGTRTPEKSHSREVRNERIWAVDCADMCDPW
jgi:hypothetical protein